MLLNLGLLILPLEKHNICVVPLFSRTNTRLHTQSLRNISPSANKDPEKTEGKFPLDTLDIVTLDEVDIPDDVKEKIAVYALTSIVLA